MSTPHAASVNPQPAHYVVVGALAALSAQVFVGVSFVALDALARYPFALGQTVRYALATALLVAIARGAVTTPRGVEWLRVLGLAALGLVVFNLVSLEGVARSDAASVGVVVGCVPIVLGILGPLQRGERPHPGVVVAGVVVAAGAALVQAGGAHPTRAGFALALVALGCEAAFTLLAVPLLPRLGPIGVSVWTCATATGLLALWALSDVAAWRAPHGGEWIALAWLTLFVTAAAFMLWYGAVVRIGAERAGLMCGVLPVAAAVGAAVVGTSAVTRAQFVGTLLVACGVTGGLLVSQRRRGRRGSGWPPTPPGDGEAIPPPAPVP